MKTYLKLFFVLFFFHIYSVNSNAQTEQYDVTVSITEADFNDILTALIEARGLNWGEYIDGFVTAWFVNVAAATVDIIPNNVVKINVNLVASANFDLGLFQPNLVAHPTGTFTGNISLTGNNNDGFRLIFTPVSDNLNPLSWATINLLPSIEINLGTSILPAGLGNLFTTTVPYLETTNDEIILGYNFAGPREVTIKNKIYDREDLSFFKVKNENGIWEEHNSPHKFYWELNSTHQAEANTAIVSYNRDNYKFRWWNGSTSSFDAFKNILADRDKIEELRFGIVHPLTLNTNLLEGGSGGKIIYEEQEYQSPLTTDGFQSPNYSRIGVPQIQQIGNYKYQFSSWGDGNTSNPRNIAISGNSNFTANLKGIQISNHSSAFQNSSQRKFIKTNDGVMHHVYESMGKVWYEKSTNNGGDWTLMNGGKPLSNYPSKNPSIAGVNNFRVLIVFQETTQVGFFIKVFNINFLNDQILDTEQIELLQESDADVDPIIEYSVAGSPDYIVISWKENLENNWLGEPGYYGIIGRLQGGVMNLDNISLYNGSITKIPDTDINSHKMAISKNSFHTYDNSFYLTWEQVDPESGDHSINFDSLHVISQINDADFYFYPMQTVSSISGYENHYEPSLTIMNDNIARICWIGQRQIEETDEIQSNVIFAASDNPTFFRTFGYKVNSANINRADNGNAYVIGWSEEEGEINRIVDNYLSGSHIRDLNMTGKNIQICNGSTFSNMYATAFNAGSLPYYFLQSNNIQSYYINSTKVSTTSISEGREGIVAKNKLQFYFGVGDVKVDNELVSFKEIADSVRFSNLQTLNQYLTTEPFQLTDNSSFYYSVRFGVTDTSYAQNSLTSNSFVTFRILLVDDNTNQLLGTYDEVTYTLDNLLQHKNIAYQVNTNGIGNRTVRLALEVTENIEPKYALAEKYADDYVITKEKYETISFQGKLGVTEYALEQNYPNPFNPATTICYQIPKAGRVTLKVYDILGKEIATLVNEEKETGRYTVRFDASNLSSGVYLYEIVVNDYRAVKKLIVIK